MNQQDDRTQYIQKEMVKIGIMDTPGALLVGLGLYGKFGAQGNAFHPLLNDQDILNSMLMAGGAIMAYCLYRSISLVLVKKNIDRD